MSGLAVLSVSALAACGGGGGGSDDSVSLNLGHVFTDGTPISQAAADFASRVEEETDGRVTVRSFGNSQLGSDTEMAEGLVGGTLDCSVLNHAVSGLDPKLQLGWLPYVVTDYEGADELFYGDGFVAQHDTELLESKGMTVFGYLENDFRGLSNSRAEVTTPEDMAGLKLRVPEIPMYIDLFETWDTQPVAMAFEELYTALQQGTVDGQDNGPILSADSKFGEVQTYFTDTNHAYAVGSILCNDEALADVSPEDIETMTQVAEAVSEEEREANRATTDDSLQIMADEGVQIIEITDEQRLEFAEVKDGVWDGQAEVFGADVIEELRKASESVGE